MNNNHRAYALLLKWFKLLSDYGHEWTNDDLLEFTQVSMGLNKDVYTPAQSGSDGTFGRLSNEITGHSDGNFWKHYSKRKEL